MSDNPDQPTPRHPSGMDPGRRLGRRRRTRWIFMGGVLAVVALLTALFSFGLSRDPTIVRSALIGRAAPDFSLKTLDGKRTVRLSDFHGQIVVVNFWASWCGDCRIEHGALAAAWQRYQDQGVVFVGIPFQDAPSASRAYLASYGGDWPQLSDPGSAAALRFGVYGVPETYFIDPTGRIAFKRVGPVTYEMLTDQITHLLPGGSR